MPEETFSGLFEETAGLDWAPTEGLRRRARQRRRRQRFAAGAAAAAVVAVVAAGTAFAIDRGPEPEPPATPAPSVSPSVSGPAGPSASSGLGGASGTPGGSSSSGATAVVVTDIPLTAMLTPADAGSGGWTRQDGVDGDWTTGFTFSICPTADSTWPADSVDDREAELSGPSSRYVLQSVTAFPSAAAARAYVGWVRGNVRRCASFEQVAMSTVDQAFAGDESLMVRTKTPDKDLIHGFVREGNLVTEYSASERTQARAAQLGTKAAARMCAVTRTC